MRLMGRRLLAMIISVLGELVRVWHLDKGVIGGGGSIGLLVLSGELAKPRECNEYSEPKEVEVGKREGEE
jgi:hypothetical protein